MRILTEQAEADTQFFEQVKRAFDSGNTQFQGPGVDKLAEAKVRFKDEILDLAGRIRELRIKHPKRKEDYLKACVHVARDFYEREKFYMPQREHLVIKPRWLLRNAFFIACYGSFASRASAFEAPSANSMIDLLQFEYFPQHHGWLFWTREKKMIEIANAAATYLEIPTKLYRYNGKANSQ